MKFAKLDKRATIWSRASVMAMAHKTEIQTQMDGKWVHDAYDSDKPMV